MAAAPTTKLPRVPEDITAGWLTEVLGRKVKSAKLDKVVHGTASKVMVHAVFEDDASGKVVPLCVKGGFNPEFLAAMPFVVGVYHCEADFFTHMAPKLEATMDLPRSLWAGKDEGQGIVIMDDLTTLGYTFGTTIDEYPVSFVLAGVEQLAALHARTWHARPEDYTWQNKGYHESVYALLQTYNAVVTMPDRPKIPEYMQDQDRVTAVVRRFFTKPNPRFYAMVHGDVHTGNTFLTPTLKHPRFLDWQATHLGSAFHDVSYFIGAALSVEDRRAREFDILDHYLRSLEKLGVPEVLSRNDPEVVAEYKKGYLAGIGWILCPYEMQPRENVYPMAVRYAAALDDHKVIQLVEEEISKNP